MSASIRLINWTKYHKKALTVTGIIFALLVIVNMISVYATGSGVLNLAFSMLDFLADSSRYNDIADMLAVTVSEGETRIGGRQINGMWGIVSTINNTAQSYATMILVVTFGIGLFNTIVTQQVNIELVIKKYLMLAACIFLVTQSMDISLAFCGLGNSLASKVSAASADSTDIAALKETMTDECNQEVPANAHWWDHILIKIENNVVTPFAYCLALFIPYVVHWICWLLVQIKCIARGVEVIALSALSPFACCMIQDGHSNFGNGSAARLFKNVAAVALQGVIIIVAMQVSSSLSVGAFDALIQGGFSASELGNAAWTSCMAGVAACALSMQSLSIAQKVLGLQ